MSPPQDTWSSKTSSVHLITNYFSGLTWSFQILSPAFDFSMVPMDAHRDDTYVHQPPARSWLQFVVILSPLLGLWGVTICKLEVGMDICVLERTPVGVSFDLLICLVFLAAHTGRFPLPNPKAFILPCRFLLPSWDLDHVLG